MKQFGHLKEHTINNPTTFRAISFIFNKIMAKYYKMRFVFVLPLQKNTMVLSYYHDITMLFAEAP